VLETAKFGKGARGYFFLCFSLMSVSFAEQPPATHLHMAFSSAVLIASIDGGLCGADVNCYLQ